MAAVLFVELPSANTEAAAGDRGGFFYDAAGLLTGRGAMQPEQFIDHTGRRREQLNAGIGRER